MPSTLGKIPKKKGVSSAKIMKRPAPSDPPARAVKLLASKGTSGRAAKRSVSKDPPGRAVKRSTPATSPGRALNRTILPIQIKQEPVKVVNNIQRNSRDPRLLNRKSNSCKSKTEKNKVTLFPHFEFSYARFVTFYESVRKPWLKERLKQEKHTLEEEREYLFAVEHAGNKELNDASLKFMILWLGTSGANILHAATGKCEADNN